MAVNFDEAIAKDFIKTSKRDGISLEFSEFKNSKYKSNYDRIVGEILNSDPVEDNKNYKPLDYNEILYRSVVIVKYLLGDAVSNQELANLTNIVRVTDNENVMDGYFLDIIYEGKRQELLVIPKMDKTASIICLVHKMMHYFENNRKFKTFSNYRYNETMSQLGERLACYFVDGDGLENNITHKLGGIRLDAIKYQQEGLIYMDLQIREFPMIKYDPEFVNLSTYERSRDHAYLVGFINQVGLFDRYLDDEKTFLSKLNAIFKGNIKVPDMLDYYGIDIKKNEITDKVISVVKKYK